MRLVRFLADGRCGYGLMEEGGIRPVAWEPFDYIVDTVQIVDPESACLLAPVVPTKIVAVGLNYTDHARELNMEIPEQPLLFLKAPNTVLHPGGEVVYPPQSRQVDYEAELAVVIGTQARSVSEQDALSCVLGYTCGFDMTARDLQRADGQWTRAKNFDTFCPLGPWVETELDPGDLGINLRLNDELRQSSRTSRLIFGVAYLVSFISGIMTLLPGDIVMTGTPAGVGEVRPGDRLDMEIEGIGNLTCTITGS
jgi:2-keto-4-pentenoate hydratase/2-oxohepta-3-ene-1,7-dioic acid hydratase in catechol pathway